MPPGGFVHQALRYASDLEFLGGTVPFVTEGLSEGDRVLAVTTATNIKLLHGLLGRDAQRVEFVDALEWYGSPGRTTAAYHRYVERHKGPPGRVRVIGEPVWSGRSAVQTREWLRYESVINVAFAGADASIICPYDLRTVPPEVADEVGRTHPELVTGYGDPLVSEVYADPGSFSAEYDGVPLDQPGVPVRVTRLGPGGLAAARELAHACATRAGFTGGRREEIVLALAEVAANALLYGGGRAVLRAWEGGGALVLETADEGPGAGAAEPFLGQVPPDPSARSGVGLWVVRQLSDLVEMRTGPAGTTVRLHFTLPPTP